MNNLDRKDFYGHSTSIEEDPQLRTTTKNYDFKYNSPDHLERVINRVKMEREINNARGIYNFPKSAKAKPTYQKNSLPTSACRTLGDDQLPKTHSGDTIVKIMSDAEIEAMISQAMLSRPYMPKDQQSGISISLRGRSSDTLRTLKTNICNPTSEVRRIERKYSKISEEVILLPQPQWVQLKPAEKAFAYTVDSPKSFEPNTANLNENRSVGENTDLLDTVTYEYPLHGKSSTDLILCNEGSDHGGEAHVTPPESLLSFGIESPLNDRERVEMLRVLGHVMPQIPPMELGASERQDESPYSDSIGDEEVDDEEDLYEDCKEKIGSETHTHEVQEPSYGRQQSCREGQLHPVQQNTQSIPNTGKSLYSSGSNLSYFSRGNYTVAALDKKTQKQIEDLKQEKIRIFSKMTSIQEKIIEVLERLRISLVELSLPDGQVEVKLRERNAIEFSVRLSRNYLFPLGRMIEELRALPKEDFHSATTNEACIKVCGIFGLLNQALQCYHKQLRHFFTDSVPKKLDILLNMVIEATKICLSKKIFDQRDTLIQCLLMRCDLFMEFVLYAAEQRKSAREEESPPKSSRRSHHKLPRTSSKWELTMNLNNLNMYEPQLVPKVQKKKHHKKKTPTARQSMKRNHQPPPTPRVVEKYNRNQEDCIAVPPTDPDDTQVRLMAISNTDSLQIFERVLEEQPESELTKYLIETLQNITKDEVRHILGPIFSNFDSILQNSVSPSV